MNRYLARGRRAVASGAVILSCLTGTTLVSLSAFAGDATEEDINRARRLFQRGLEYEAAKNWGKALELFREVGGVKLTPQVRYHIALCEENLGKLVAALGGFELALAQADQVGEAFRGEVEANVARLRESIPKLVIKRGKGAEAATIALDGVELGMATIGKPIPTDPGPHTVTATAPGYKDFMDTVSLGEKEAKTLEIVMKALPTDTNDDQTTPPGGDGKDAGTWEPPDRTVPYIVGGGGAVALLVAGGMFFLRLNAISKLEDACGPGGFSDCDPEDRDTANGYVDDAKMYTTLAGVSAGLGAAALGVAGTMILTEPKAPEKQGRLGIAPMAPGAHAGVTLFGRF